MMRSELAGSFHINVPVFSCEGQRAREALAAVFVCCNTLLACAPTLSRSGSQILAKDARVARGDSQERDRWSLGGATTLLPVSKSVNANTHGASKACLRQADKPTERSDIVA